MSTSPPSAQRGLLAGLVALVLFASTLVSMTAHSPATASAAATTTASPDQTQVVFDDRGFDGGGRGGGGR
jgi:hypothetical protein